MRKFLIVLLTVLLIGSFSGMAMPAVEGEVSIEVTLVVEAMSGITNLEPTFRQVIPRNGDLVFIVDPSLNIFSEFASSEIALDGPVLAFGHSVSCSVRDNGNGLVLSTSNGPQSLTPSVLYDCVMKIDYQGTGPELVPGEEQLIYTLTINSL